MRDIGYSGMDALIQEWCIGKNGELDREIMHELMDEAPDEQTRVEIKRLIDKM